LGAHEAAIKASNNAAVFGLAERGSLALIAGALV
jgi:hypothetical protein